MSSSLDGIGKGHMDKAGVGGGCVVFVGMVAVPLRPDTPSVMIRNKTRRWEKFWFEDRWSINFPTYKF